MKLTVLEIICLVLAFIALVLNIVSLPGGIALMNISLLLLSLYYYIFSFAILNNIKLKNIFKKSEYDNKKTAHILLSVFWGFTYPSLLLGALYRFLYVDSEWKVHLITGLVFSLILTVFSIVFLKPS